MYLSPQERTETDVSLPWRRTGKTFFPPPRRGTKTDVSLPWGEEDKTLSLPQRGEGK